MSVPSLEDLLKHFSLTTSSLEVEIAEELYDDVASCLSDWGSVARSCGINIKDYNVDHRSEKARRIALLSDLKMAYNFKATYNLLVTKLVELKRTEDAGKVCKVFKGMKYVVVRWCKSMYLARQLTRLILSNHIACFVSWAHKSLVSLLSF